jgi:hypothetical protein
VKNRFQSLPFKFNLQRYNSGDESADGVRAAPAGGDRGGAVHKLNHVDPYPKPESVCVDAYRLISWFQAFAFKCNLCRYAAQVEQKEEEEEGEGGAVQVDSRLESAWFQPLNLRRNFLVSKNLLFKFNLQRYTTNTS